MDEITQQLQQEQAKLEDILRQQRDALNANNLIQLEREGLEASLQRIQGDYNNAEEKLKSTSDEIDALVATRVKKTEELEAVNSQIVEASAVLEQKKAEYDRLCIDISAKNDELQRLNTQKQEEYDQIKRNFEQDMAGLRKEYEYEAQKKQSIVGEVSALQHKIAVLASEYAEETKKNQELVDINTRLGNEVATMQKSIVSLSTEVTDLEKRKAIFENEIESLKALCIEKNNELRAISEDIEKNNTKNKDFMIARANVIKEKEECEQRLAFLQQTYKDLDIPW